MVINNALVFDDLEKAIDFFVSCYGKILEGFEGAEEREKFKFMRRIIFKPANRICGAKASELVANNSRRFVLSASALKKGVTGANEATAEPPSERLLVAEALYNELSELFSTEELADIIERRRSEKSCRGVYVKE